jgi:hypothetical protein
MMSLYGIVITVPFAVFLLMPRSPFYFGPAAFIIMLVLMWILAWRESGQRHVEDGVAVLLGSGLCPSCLYTLSPTPHESDMRVVCPECSAAWKSRNIGTILGDRPGA